MQDYTADAKALFNSFAQRHRLTYAVDNDAPVEVLWHFPAQARLSHPIWLGLQNTDELNFGVGSFYTDLFPFPDVAERFASILDAWVEGQARVVRTSPWTLALQTQESDGWQTAYRHGALFPTFWREPKILQNAPARS